MDSRTKRFRWVGLASFLMLAGIIFVFMMVYGALTASPNYPQKLAAYVIGFSYLALAFSVFGAIAFALLLCKTYDLHLFQSINGWFRRKGDSPWQ